MIVGEPLQQGIGLDPDHGVRAGRATTERRGGFQHLVAHLSPVADREADIGQDLLDLVLEQFQVLLVGFPVHREANIGLGDAVVRRLQYLLESPPAVPPHPQDRVHGHVDGEALSIDGRRDRVDQEGHIVVHHLDDREGRLVAVLFLVGIEDPEQRLAGFPDPGEVEMRRRRLAHDPGGTSLHVLVRHVGKVLVQEAFGLLAGLQGVGSGLGGDDFVDQAR